MITEYYQLHKQICPLIDEIITNHPINSTLKLKKKLSIESKCTELIKEIIKPCKYDWHKKDNALFSTTYLDRATICHSLNKLSFHIKTLKLSSRVKVIFPEYLLHLTEKIERLEMAIKLCEAIKAKQINERSSFTAFPTDIQIKIITSVPFSDWPCLHNFMSGLKHLYKLDEPLFYRIILPLLINEGLLKVNKMDSYPLEFREIAPYLKSIDVSASLLYQSKINAKQLTSVQSLKIDYLDYINFRTSNLYPGEFSEELDEEIFDHLGFLTQIKKIEFTGCAGYFDVLSLKKLTNLHTLSLNVSDNSNFTDFSHLTNLQTLKLGFTAEKNEELKSLGYGISRMTHLKNLYLDLTTENFLSAKDLRLLVMPTLENVNICYGSFRSKSYANDTDDLTDFLKKECPNTNIFLKKINLNKSSNTLSIADIEELKQISKIKFFR